MQIWTSFSFPEIEGCLKDALCHFKRFSSLLSAEDENEVALCIKDLNSPNFYPSMVSLWVTDSFERKDMERDLLAKLLINLTRSQDRLLSQVQLLKG